ncbi:MAG: Crp/Fnr family transcriptional regulator, partial [Bdellovibrionota bacterium]
MGVRAPKPVAPPPQAPAGAAPPAAGAPGGIFKLKRGQLLFSEGEASRAIYVLRNGMIRLYLKKGDSVIELDTVRSGQVLGELAFLDGMPRSASAEALTDCELLEISGPTFLEVLRKTPDWLKMLLKAVVGRLRSSNTRIRQLESASTAFDYSNTDGKRVSHYVFLSPSDALRLVVGCLAVGARSQKTEHGHELRIGLLNRYCQQILSIPAAKITSFIHILEKGGLVHSTGEDQHFLKSPELLEETIAYLNEENLLDPAKRHDLSHKGFAVMGMIARH